MRGLLHLVDQETDKAIAEMRNAARLANGNSRPDAVLAIYLARLGQQEEARAIPGEDDPRLSELRGGPRFAALMRKLKLDRYGPGLAPL